MIPAPTRGPGGAVPLPRAIRLASRWRLHPRADTLLVALAVIAGAAWYTRVELQSTALGFPLDDAWIHLQFAHNLASRGEFAFNPGEVISGSSAPLWTAVLAIPAWLGVDAIVSAKVIGVALVLATALLAGELARALTGSRFGALVAALAVALSTRMTWGGLSGMEVPLYAGLSIAALVAYLKAIDPARPAPAVWWGLLAGLAGIARPETFLLFPLLALDWLVRWRRDGWFPSAQRRLAPLLAFAASAGAFVALNLAAGGRPLPSTYYAKTYGMGTLPSLMEGRFGEAFTTAWTFPVEYFADVIDWSVSQSAILGAAALAGVLVLCGVLRDPRPSGDVAVERPPEYRPGAWLPVAVFLGTPLVKGLVAAEPPILVHEGRYIAHLLVIFFVMAAAGLVALQRRARVRWVVPAVAAAALLRLAAGDVEGANLYASQVRNINELQVRSARWIAAHTSPDALVATNDIGALGYLGGRRILDTEGLISPDAVQPKRMRDLMPFLERHRPDVLVIFPDWYPELLREHGGAFEEIHRVAAERVVAGGPALVFYRTPWTRDARLRPLP